MPEYTRVTFNNAEISERDTEFLECWENPAHAQTVRTRPSLFSWKAWERGYIIIIFFIKPAISLSEQASALIVSPNLSTVDGGVHGHQAIVFLSP